METEAGMSIQPGADVDVGMGGRVVEHQVEVQRLGELAVKTTQEAEELLMVEPLGALDNHFAIKDVERGVEAGGAAALVVVSDGDGLTLFYLQPRVSAIAI